jgi:hypothetical protein
MNSILSRVPLLCESLVLGRPMPARDAAYLALSSPDGARVCLARIDARPTSAELRHLLSAQFARAEALGRVQLALNAGGYLCAVWRPQARERAEVRALEAGVTRMAACIGEPARQ